MHHKKHLNKNGSKIRSRRSMRRCGGTDVPVAQPAAIPMATAVPGGNNEPPPLDVRVIVDGLISMALNITMMVTVVLLVIIVGVSVINLLILGSLVATDTFGYDTDVIYKDTFKYKILRYIDFLNSKAMQKIPSLGDEGEAQPTPETTQSSFLAYIGFPTTTGTTPATTPVIVAQTTTTTQPSSPPAITEPYFFIYGANVNMLSMIYLCYVFLLIICILAAIIYVVFAYFVKIMYRDFNVKIDGNSNIIYTLFSVPTFLGFGVAAILGIFHWIYIQYVIDPSLRKIRKAIYNIDLEINRALVVDSGSSKFSAELFKLLSKRSKGPNDFSRYKTLIQRDIASNQLEKAKQKIILIILYAHLHDQIPDTNMRAQKLINYYFFKNPVTTADNLDIQDVNEFSDLTFISLLTESTGIQQIKKEYIDYDFYTCTTTLNQEDVNKVKSSVKNFFKDLNNQLTSFPEFKSNMDIFAGYFIVFLVLSFISAFIFFKTIATYQANYNQSIKMMADNISVAMTRVVPQLGEITGVIGGATTKPDAGASGNIHSNAIPISSDQGVGHKAAANLDDTTGNTNTAVTPNAKDKSWFNNLFSQNKNKAQPQRGSVRSEALSSAFNDISKSVTGFFNSPLGKAFQFTPYGKVASRVAPYMENISKYS